MNRLPFFYILLVFALCPSLTKAQEIPYFVWADDGKASESASGSGMVTDKAGNSYITGQYAGNGNFGNYQFISNNGSLDVFIIKYDNAGNMIWADTFGGPYSDNASGIAIDNDGNLYVTGYFYKTITIGDSIFYGRKNNVSDAFIVKISPAGKIIWARHAGGNNNCQSLAIATDNINKDIYITGLYSDSVGFGDLSLVTSPIQNAVFLAKYNMNGNIIWVRKGESSSYPQGRAVTVDNSGNVFMGGAYYSTLTFSNYNLANSDAGDGFAVKYSSNGDFLWARSTGTTGGGWVNGLATDKSGNLYETGLFYTSIEIDGHKVISQGQSDIFVEKYSTIGNLLWVHGAGGISPDEGTALLVDKWNNVFFTGAISDLTAQTGIIKIGSADPKKSTTSSAGANSVFCQGGYGDICLSEIDSLGNQKWLIYMGGPLEDEGYGIGEDSMGSIYLGGVIQSSVVLGNDSFNTGPYIGMFTAKLSYDSIIPNPASIRPVQNFNESSFSIYPNPANDIIVLRSNFHESTNSTITLKDAYGKTLYVQQKPIPAGIFNQSFNVSSLRSGIYFLNIQTQSGSYTGKMIKE